ncbi:MAG TPA: hypothetical protein VJN96_25840 [Vicinamibacterales bacterium]|nr:hypothetical protein [Vicinamibacterales bacterium]
MCALLLPGVWWIFPLVGMLICLGFFLVMLRSWSTGHGCMGMHRHRATHDEAK